MLQLMWALVNKVEAMAVVSLQTNPGPVSASHLELVKRATEHWQLIHRQGIY